jgi:fructuronate reductase
MDGSQKLPQRLLNTIRARLAVGAPFARLALGVAAWMRYATGFDEKGQKIEVRDPLAARIPKAGRERRTSPCGRLSRAQFGVFGADLSADQRFCQAVTAALGGLIERGAARTVAEFPEG